MLERLEDRTVPSTGAVGPSGVTVASGPDGSTYAIFGGDREVWAHHPDGTWAHLIDNVRTVSVNLLGDIDVLGTDGVLRQWSHDNPSWGFWTVLDGGGNIGTIAAGSQRIYLTWGWNRELWSLNPNNGDWIDLHTSNVVDIGGWGMAVVYANGALGVQTEGTPIGPYTVVVPWGVHHVANGEYGAEILFTRGSDSELWGYNFFTGNFYNYHINYVAQVSSVSDNGNYLVKAIDYVGTNGELMHAGDYSQDIYSGAWTY
jgi:hypothetical protein